jgi:hypothetical protein
MGIQELWRQYQQAKESKNEALAARILRQIHQYKGHGENPATRGCSSCRRRF